MLELCAAVRRCLEQNSLLNCSSRLLCGVSGGADSVALLYALCELRREAGLAVCAVHVQHGLRGEASQEDERFVRSLCQSLDVPLRVETLTLHATMEQPGIETLARVERRSAFARAMEAEKAHALLLAHHRGDQAETVLMHLLRGSGAAGLCGMQESVPFACGRLLRPFLGLSKTCLLEALGQAGLPHREDASNAEPVTPRNALRLHMLPAMEALYPGAEGHIAQAAERLQTDEAFLAREAERLFRQAAYLEPPFCSLRLDALREADAALLRRALRLGYQAAAHEPDERSLSYADTLALVDLLAAPAGTCHNLPGRLRAVRQEWYLHFASQDAMPLPLPEPPQAIEPGHARYAFRHGQFAQESACATVALPTDAHTVLLSPEVLALRPVLRLPQPGDRIHPFGAPGSKPLRRLLTDRHTDPFFRLHLPVLAAGGEVLWVPSLCASERLRLSAVPAGSLRLIHLSHPDLPKE